MKRLLASIALVLSLGTISGCGPECRNRPPVNARGMGGGGSGGNTGGTSHKGGTSSSSVHDGIKILVVSMAAGVSLVIAGVGAFLAHGYGLF